MPRLRASFQIPAVGSQNLAILIQLIIEPVPDLVSQFENGVSVILIAFARVLPDSCNGAARALNSATQTDLKPIID